jgi:acyl-CoA synthetase (AMP-forming)/AMP-acid ligase II
VKDAVAVGVPSGALGHAIVVVATAVDGGEPTDKLMDYCRQNLPNFMVPGHIHWRDALPRSPNGKYDRPLLSAEMRELFAQQ